MRVLLIEDDSATAQSIELMLKSESFNVYTTDLGEEGVDLGKLYDYDIILLDLNMPGRSGLEVLTSLRETHSAIKVLVVSMYPEDQYALRCLKAGAQGYANKAGDPVELIAAVRTVMQGRKYLTAEVAQMLADSLAQPTPEAPHTALSERELQTLVKIASGRRLSDIAEELMLSPKTVSVYRSRVLEKLKLSNNAELTVYAIRNQLV